MTEVVSITVPAMPAWNGVVELVLAGLGARLDLPYDRIDELQLATTAVLTDAHGPDVRVDASAHTTGVHRGNSPGSYAKQIGHHADGTADARRSTGVAPGRHDVILPVMPNLPPG